MTTHCRRKTSAAARCLLRLGSRSLLRRVWLADNFSIQCFSTHNPHPQTKGSQQLERYRARRFAESSARTALCQDAPVACCCANSASRTLPVRLFSCRLYRGHTTCLHFAVLAYGRASTAGASLPMVSPTASYLHRQSHAFRAVPHLVFAAPRLS